MDMRIASAYCDGGSIGSNPSAHGGTWACCHVNTRGERIKWDSGIILPADFGVRNITNNVAELYAAVKCLEALPGGWSGNLYTDSQVTIYRVGRKQSTFKNVPESLVHRLKRVRARLGKVEVRHIGRHAKRPDHIRGPMLNRTPLSKHHVFCDQLCSQEATRFRSGQCQPLSWLQQCAGNR
jgi:ribonuclease HI